MNKTERLLVNAANLAPMVIHNGILTIELSDSIFTISATSGGVRLCRADGTSCIIALQNFVRNAAEQVNQYTSLQIVERNSDIVLAKSKQKEARAYLEMLELDKEENES